MPSGTVTPAAGGGSGTVTSVSSSNTAIGVATGTTTPVLTAATLDVIAADGPPAANWSNNSKKITSVAVATAATDAASLANTLDQFGAPAANVAWNSHKITGIASGTAATDVSALSQTQPPINVLTPLAGFVIPSSTGALAASGHCYGCRYVVPKTGTLHDLAIYVGTSSGNIEVGILDTTATTRNRLYTTGSIAAPAGNSWRVVGDPALSVTQGDHIDLYMSADNTTVTVMRTQTGGPVGFTPLPANFLVSPLGGAPNYFWDFTGSSIGSTVAESSLAAAASTAHVFISARIS